MNDWENTAAGNIIRKKRKTWPQGLKICVDDETLIPSGLHSSLHATPTAERSGRGSTCASIILIHVSAIYSQSCELCLVLLCSILLSFGVKCGSVAAIDRQQKGLQFKSFFLLVVVSMGKTLNHYCCQLQHLAWQQGWANGWMWGLC